MEYRAQKVLLAFLLAAIASLLPVSALADDPVSCEGDADGNTVCLYPDGHSAITIENPFFPAYRAIKSNSQFLVPTMSWEGVPFSESADNPVNLTPETLGTFGWSYTTNPPGTFTPYLSYPLPFEDVLANSNLTLTLYRGKIGAAETITTTAISHASSGTIANTRLFDQPGHYFVVITATYSQYNPVPGLGTDEVCPGQPAEECALPFFNISRWGSFVRSGIERNGNPPGLGLYQPVLYGITEFDVVDAATYVPPTEDPPADEEPPEDDTASSTPPTDPTPPASSSESSGSGSASWHSSGSAPSNSLSGTSPGAPSSESASVSSVVAPAVSSVVAAPPSVSTVVKKVVESTRTRQAVTASVEPDTVVVSPEIPQELPPVNLGGPAPASDSPKVEMESQTAGIYNSFAAFPNLFEGLNPLLATALFLIFLLITLGILLLFRTISDWQDRREQYVHEG